MSVSAARLAARPLIGEKYVSNRQFTALTVLQCARSSQASRPLRNRGHRLYCHPLKFRGRTGFDLKFEAQAACRGWFVGLVKNRAKKNKRRSPRSRSRGLIDRDVWSWTPATAPNVDSRLIVRRSDRAGR